MTENKREKEWKWFNGAGAVVFTTIHDEDKNFYFKKYEIISKDTIEYLDETNPMMFFEDVDHEYIWRHPTTGNETPRTLERMRHTQYRGTVITDEDWIDKFFEATKYSGWSEGNICFNMEEGHLDDFMRWWREKENGSQKRKRIN